MPRTARAQSAARVYHVMMRGINQSQLFYDDEDRNAFLERLARYKKECSFTLYAYCLMGNHFHLLIEENEVALSAMVKRLALSYSYWFNAKYERSGYLFQGRYKSEPIETDEHLLMVFRYILDNPSKIGLSKSYWTSYDEYLGRQEALLTDTSFVLGMFADDATEARKELKAFIDCGSSEGDSTVHNAGNRPGSDEKAAATILRVSGFKHCTDVADMNKERCQEMLKALRAERLSIRQIARLTGISRNVVYRATK